MHGRSKWDANKTLTLWPLWFHAPSNTKKSIANSKLNSVTLLCKLPGNLRNNYGSPFGLWEEIAQDGEIVEFLTDLLTLFSGFHDFSVSCNARSTSKSNIAKFRGFHFFRIVREFCFDRCSIFNLWYKNRGPTFWQYRYVRYSTMSQSLAIASRKPKCADLAHWEPRG